MNTAQVEAKKYERMWEHPDYGKFSPGERYVELFMEMSEINKQDGCTIADLGCGCGRASLELEKYFMVYMFDHIETSRDADVISKLGDRFTCQCLWEPFSRSFDYGYCCDVMEHIPTEYVMQTLTNIMSRCERVFFSICPHADHFGQTIGETLHLTVKPFTWWKDRLNEVGTVLDARDFMGDCIFYVEQ